MILRFLRLFVAFRELERGIEIMDRCRIEIQEATDRRIRILTDSEASLRSALQEESAGKLLLQDRLDATLADRARMWDLIERSIEDMKIGYQAHINKAWYEEGHSAPYPDAPHPSRPLPRQVENSTQPRPMSPSEAVAHETQRFVRQHLSPK